MEATGAEATEATAAEGSAGGGAAGGGGLAPRREKERSFDSGLDQGQRRAAAAALAEPLSQRALQQPAQPGSGKSRVVVEAVRRAAAQGQRVLVCAPSNNAVDQLALRLQRADPALRLLRYAVAALQPAAALQPLGNLLRLLRYGAGVENSGPTARSA